MKKHVVCMRLIVLICLLILSDILIVVSLRAQAKAGKSADAGGQITFQTTTTQDEHLLWRIQAQANSTPENLTLKLDSIALYPGQHQGPITVSPDGSWYVFMSERFDLNSQGNPGLTIARADLRSAETIRSNGQTIHGWGGQAIAGGTAVVYVDGGGPHTRDLFIVRRQDTTWTIPFCVTAQSPFAWNYWPVLSIDNAKVAFDAGDSSYPSIRVCEARLDGTGFRVLVTKDDGPVGLSPSAEAHSPAYTPDGSLIFESGWGGSDRIWRLSSPGETPVLVNSTFTNDNSPNVLPDGRVVSLWISSLLGDGLHEIKVMDSNGQNFVMLTSSSSPFLEVDDIGLGCGPSFVSTDVAESKDVPVGYALHQNYPNPFNPSTEIRYDLPTASTVHLTIYNLLGNEVATLVDKEQYAGFHSVDWQPAVASGVYFYKLETSSLDNVSRTFLQVRRMVLLK